jgi:iron(III) transport system permease protein
MLKKPSNPWLFCSWVLALLLISCLIPLVWNSFGSDAVWSHLSTYLLPSYAKNTALLVVGVSIGTLLIGVSTAYLTTRYQFIGRSWLEKALILPLAVPSYLLAYALAGFFDYTGPFKQSISWLFSEQFSSHAFLDVQHLGGLILVISIALYPYVYLTAKTAFSHLSKQYVEVGLTLSLSATQTWRKLILPMSFPAISGSLLLVVMECLNDYGASKYFGVNTLTTGVFRAWFSMNSLASASKLAGILLSIILLLSWVKQLIQSRKKYEASSNKLPLKRILVSKRKQVLFFVICLTPIAIGIVIPLLYMVYAWAIATVDLSFIPYKSMIGNSLFLAFLVGITTTIISFSWQFTSHYFRAKKLNKLTQVASMGYTIPGAVIGIGVLGLATYFHDVFNWYISGSFILLIFGLTFRLIAVSFQNVKTGFKQLPKSTIDLGSSLGISSRKMFKSIYFPLSKSYLAIGFLLVFIDTLKELPLTLILRPFNFDTLATKTYEYANDELLLSAFHVAPLIILISIVPIWLLQKTNAYD